MRRRRQVVVVGAGVAGMTAAHELLERGFQVTLLERRGGGEYGGRARSYRRRLFSLTGDRMNIEAPVEHGFRFFPGFYRNISDTMARIPLQGQAVVDQAHRTVHDNLVHIDREWLSVSGKRVIDVPAATVGVRNPTQRLLDLLRVPKSLLGVGLTREDLEIFSDRMWQIASSCTARRNGEYEKLGWREFVESLDRSDEYYWYLASGLTRTLVAAKARKASAKTMGVTAFRLLMCLFEQDNTTDRVLNGPTNQAWFDPWLAHLHALAAEHQTTFRLCQGAEVVGTDVETSTARGSEPCRVVGLHVRSTGAPGGRSRRYVLRGFDHAVFALPMAALADLLNRDVPLADALGHPLRDNVTKLSRDHVDSMHGLQIFVRKRLPLNRGHQILLDSPWGLTSIAQGQFWKRNHLPRRVADVLSVDISSWDLPSLAGTKPAEDSTNLEIFQEVLRQLRNGLGSKFLADRDVVGWYLDEGIKQPQEKLLVNNAGSWALRPTCRTNAPNVHLAGDYLRTFTDLACMEGANESARAAVNQILAAEGLRTDCRVFDAEDQEPAWLRPLKELDQLRFNRGLPWSGSATGKWAIRGMWAGHTLGAIALAQDEGGSLAAAGVVPSEPEAGLMPHRLKPELWHPAYQTEVAGRHLAPKDEVAFSAERAQQLADRDVEDLLVRISAQPGRSDPMFKRWRLSMMTYQGKHFPIPFLVYDGDTLVIHGRARNFEHLERWTAGTGYQPVYSLEGGQKVGFSELWIVQYTDTVGGLYNEVVLNFVVSKLQRPPYRWRSEYSSIVPMMDNANRLFTVRLLLDVKQRIQAGPIDYGRELFGMDKRPGEVDIERANRTKYVVCRENSAEVLRVRIDETASVLQDLTNGIELGRELGARELVKNTRQALDGDEIRGGMVSPDFRTARRKGLGRSATIDVQARYKFNPRILPIRKGDFSIGKGQGDDLAHLLREMDFQAQIATADPHLKSVLFLEGWPSPEGRAAPDRPPGTLVRGVMPRV
ncbi:MAG: FAD-dependent oxidoreductase [Myxococcales bacterium]